MTMKHIIVHVAMMTYGPWSSSVMTQCGGESTANGFGSNAGGPSSDIVKEKYGTAPRKKKDFEVEG
jgi:hypothetical protein